MYSFNSPNTSFRRIGETKAILETTFVTAGIIAELGRTPTKWKFSGHNQWFTRLDDSMDYRNIGYTIQSIVLRTPTENITFQYNTDYFLFDIPLQFEFTFTNKNTCDSIFDPLEYKLTSLREIGFFYDQNNLVIAGNAYYLGSQFLTATEPDAGIFCPANGYSQSGNIFSNSDSFRKLNEDMVLEEFRRIAADRLECKPEQVRVKTKIINDYSELGVGKTINLTEIQDNDRTTAYIQRMNAIVNEPDPDFPSVIITDNFKNQGNEIYVSATGDTAPAATGYFADSIELYGNLTIQLIIYIAERLV